MTKELEKTKEAYGTISEEKAISDAQDVVKSTESMIEDVSEKENAAIEESVKEEVKEIDEENKVALQRQKRSFAPTTEEIISAWEPKTSLGRDVKDGKIKSIDEILDNNVKILESEVVDKLLPLKVDLISIGQAKGKFGGGKRRAWRQTQRITREGGVLTFSAMAVVGDENGHVGIGTSRAGETLPARDKSIRKAKLNIMKVKRSCAAFDCNCSDDHTVPFTVKGKSGSVSVTLIPAPQGAGLVCANELKKVLKMAGIKDVYSKTSGKVRTTFNLIKACMKALEETNRK